MLALNGLPADNFFVQHLRRSNQHLLVWNICLICTLTALALNQRPYFSNFFSKPKPVTSDELASLGNSKLLGRYLNHYYVKVHSEKMISTGLEEVSYAGVESSYTRSVKATYAALQVGQKMLIVKLPSNPRTTDFSGILVETTQPVQDTVNDIQRRYPNTQGAFLPYMLDATNFRTTGYWGLGIGIPLFLLGLWNLVQLGLRMSDPDRHPIAQALAQHGQLTVVAAAIDSEVKAAAQQSRTSVTQAVLTSSWLLISRTFGVDIIPLSDVVWFYMKVTQRTYNLIPMGKEFEATIWTRQGQSFTVSNAMVNLLPGTSITTKNNVERVLHEISQRAPWAIAGHSYETEKMWNSNRATFLATVEERRKEIIKQGN